VAQTLTLRDTEASETAFEDAAGAIRIAAQYAMLFAVRTTQPQILQPVHRLRQQRRHGRLK